MLARVIDERVTEEFVTQYLLQPASGTEGGIWVDVDQIRPEDLEPESRRALFGDA